ncbi:MAG: hypothetical protein IJR66_04560 [Clostridia bacterium]|nr:hypothetical protein [Clostridia bacterium]
MNDKLQYAKMIEIPESSASISYAVPKKKRFLFKKENKIKKEVIDKVNGETTLTGDNVNSVIQDKIVENEALIGKEETISETENLTETITVRKKKKFGVIAFEFVLIGLLFATILITNILLPNSAINNLINGNGKVETASVDERNYNDFKVVFNENERSIIAVNDGVITFSGAGSVYSPVEGKIVSRDIAEDGKITLTVEHNKNFKTVISGLDLAYLTTGETVFNNLPVGYTSGENLATMVFIGKDGATITNYTVENGEIFWEV